MASKSNMFAVLMLIAVIIGVGAYSYNKTTAGFDKTLNFDLNTLAFENNLTLNDNGELIVDKAFMLENISFASNIENLDFNMSDVKEFKLTYEVETLANETTNALFTNELSFNVDNNNESPLNALVINFNGAYGNDFDFLGNNIFSRHEPFGKSLKFEMSGNIEENYVIIRITDDEDLNVVQASLLTEEFIEGMSFDSFDLYSIEGDVAPNFKIKTLKLEYNE